MTTQTISRAGSHDRSGDVLRAIRDHIVRRGYPPTVREIMAATGLRSTSTVMYWLRQLERAGRIERRHGARAIRVLEG